MTSAGEQPALRLLSFDGGGIRGLSELLIMKEIMHGLKIEENERRKEEGTELLHDLPKPCDYFDLIGGTSTGGIIALMLGRLRMNVDNAIESYNKVVEEVFSQPKWSGGDGSFSATKLEAAMKAVVKQELINPDTPLLETDNEKLCRTFVCARNALNLTLPVLLRTYETRETHTGCTIWQAARATSATPTVFKHVEIGRSQSHVDGGIGANNPSSLVLDEAYKLFPYRRIGCIVSIGTGQPFPSSIPSPSLFQRIIPTDVIKALRGMVTDCETIHQNMLKRFTGSPKTYFRLNVNQGLQDVQLSQWEKLDRVESHTLQYMRDGSIKDTIRLLVSKIRMSEGGLTVEQIVAPRPTQPAHHIKNLKLRRPVASFTGRRDIIEKLHNYFGSNGQFQRVFVLHGLGGAGKTQLALKFLEESQQSKRFSEVFYIDATNEQTLTSYLTALSPEGVGRSAQAILDWLADLPNGNWLMFFDNANDVKLNLSPFIPQSRNGNILITTRNPQVCVYAVGVDADVRVGEMTPEDAKEFFFKRSGKQRTSENEHAAGEIVKELGYLALAISQAGAYIRSRSMMLPRYQDLYRSERGSLLQHRDIQGEDPAVYATWKLSYDQLDEPAIVLLHICSMLHREGISEEMFKRAALSQWDLEDVNLQKEVRQVLELLGKRDSEWRSYVFQNVMDSLSSYSLVESGDTDDSYVIHSLVQYWVRDIQKDKSHTRQKQVLSIVGLSVNSGDEDYRYNRILLQHALSTSSLGPVEGIDTMVASEIGLVYSSQGYWREAEGLQVVVMERRKQKLGDDHPDTLQSMNNLALTYRDQGEWQKAERLQVVVMEQRKQKLGNNHLNTLTSMDNLALTYEDQGKWQEAEKLQVVVMEQMKQKLGENHLHTLQSMHNLASTYWDQGKWEEAEGLQVMVMEQRMQKLGKNHPDTLSSMSNLASMYNGQGKWQEAEGLQVMVMEWRKQNLGENHPDTLQSMNNLALIYMYQGKWKEAEGLQVVVMEQRKQKWGGSHPYTLKSMHNLANTYCKQGEWKEAEGLQVVVMERMKQKLGENHPYTLSSMHNLAHTYWNLDKWEEAEGLESVVVEQRRKKFGESHPDTLASMNNLANMYSDQGKWEEAEGLQVVVMEQRKLKLGENHLDTLKSMSNLALTYMDQGKWKEAEELQAVATEQMKQNLGENHPDTLTSIDNLASIYSNQGKWKEAEKLQVVVMEQREQKLGESHPDTLKSMRNLALTYRHQDRSAEAETLEAMVMERSKA